MVERTSHLDRFDFDPDTHSSRDTYRTALLAAGGVLTAVETVLDGAAENAFAIVRPPGIMRCRVARWGFASSTTSRLPLNRSSGIHGLKRVMVIDWDLHHGNGTQEIFYDSAEVLYASTHQYPHYPGTGSMQEVGAGEGLGYTVNAPMPAEFGDGEYLRVFDELIIPIGRAFKPQFILISAGFDCHWRDPMGDMQVTEEGFHPDDAAHQASRRGMLRGQSRCRVGGRLQSRGDRELR